MRTLTMIHSGSLALVLSLAGFGCTPTLHDGRFTCSIDSDCPAGFQCRASDQLCHRGGEDGGGLDAGVDAAQSDAGPGDDGGDDGGGDRDGGASGCGPTCIELMVLNADPGLSGIISFVDTEGDTQQILIPPYGTTSATLEVPNVPVGDVLTVIVPPTLTMMRDLPIPREGRYLLVLGPGSVGASALMLEADRAPLHTGGYAYVQLIDMLADETEGLIARGAGRDAAARALPNPFDHDTISPVLPFLPGSPEALRIELAGAPTPIAALLADRIPGSEGTYYIVVAGRVGEHLGAGEGLRFIPGLPGATALPSARLVQVVNTLGTDVTVCDDATTVASVGPGVLSPPRVPPTSDPWTLSVRIGSSCSTGTAHEVTVDAGVSRTLVSIAGDATATDGWRPVAIPEPLPMSGASTIVVHNGLDAASDIAGVAVESLGTAAVRVFSPPASITATTPDGLRIFEWTPMSPQSWVVIGREGATYAAYEIDSPFGGAWMLTRALAM